MARHRFGVGHTCVMVAALAAIGAGPATEPTTGPTTAPADALAAADAAYAHLISAEFDGTITAHLDVGGRTVDHDATFTSAFAAPNRFRHDVPGDVTACSTGSRVFAALTGPNEYLAGDAPKGRVAAADWPADVGTLLSNQNPSLLLALVPSAKAALTRDAKDPVVLPPTTIAGVDCPTVRLDPVAADGQPVTLAFDPATHLLRRATYDLSGQMKSRGTTGVRTATVTIDYTRAEPTRTVEADRFACAPPLAAVLATAGPVAGGDQEAADDGPAAALAGKPAPAFTLSTLDGTAKVSLAEQKGKVVVLDMWATWCGPCVASLPHLDAMAAEYRKAGAAVAVFAVDQTAAESDGPDAVRAFVKDKGWTLPVLLDTDGKVGKAYLANAIPETVVVGKDGVVKKVFVGSGNEDKIKAAVEAELKR